MNRQFLLALVPLVCSATLLRAADSNLKHENFDHDPGWEEIGNRVVLEHPRTTVQDFGFSPTTSFAGGKPGEIGGKITRTSRLAYYGAKIPTHTLNEPFSASGAFTFTETMASAGVFIGFFNDTQNDTARPMNSLGMDFDCEKSGARLAVRMINAKNESCGHFVTHFIPGKFRPTPLVKGKRYEWTLKYDPQANNGGGQFTYALSGYDREKDPIDSPITVDLPPGFKQTGATFNRFGMMNMRKAGGTLAVYMDDLAVDAQKWDFSSDPQWDGVGNRTTFTETEGRGAQDFGYTRTNFAGGQNGEIGGIVWRSPFASYADRIGPVTLKQPLIAKGKVVFTGADPDSDACIGWFRSGAQEGEKRAARDFIGVSIGGPTRVGHYFRPMVNAAGRRALAKQGPVLHPDSKPHNWSCTYDPAANGGLGAVTVTLDAETVTLNLTEKLDTGSVQFDRFGLFSPGVGGSKVKIYFDDLEYTAK
ncbi:hypothetical protein [Chthoniobacter flavus]|nr:hypothetical protein [Chthoniobacter flavus]